LETDIKNWEKETQGTNGFKKDHDDVIKKYQDTIAKFTKLMEQVADDRYRLDKQIAEETQKSLGELSRRDLNVLKKAQSGQEIAHLTNSVNVYKKQISDLVGKYAAVQGSLSKEITSQESVLKQMGDQFKQREGEIQKLMEVK
jgi:chromosome segregation ATPase